MSEEKQAASNEPRQHHYVAQFQLKRFADGEGLLSVYDRQAQKYINLPPKVVAVETDLYAFFDGEGKKSREVESKVMSVLDGPVREVLDKLDDGERLSDGERLDLALFASFQMTRVPAMRDLLAEQIRKFGELFSKFMYSEPERVAAMDRRYEEATGEKPAASPEEMIEAVQGGHLRIEANPAAVLKLMVEFGFESAPLLAGLDWRVLVAPLNGRFILSDRPFVTVPPRDHNPALGGVGILTPGALKYLPLTPRTCLELGEQGGSFGFSRVDRTFVRIINMNTALNSRRFIIGGSREHLQSVVERAGAQSVNAEEASDLRVFQRDENSQLIRLSSKPFPAFRDERMGAPPSDDPQRES